MLLLGGKEYVALMHLHKEVGNDELTTAISKFEGKITQLPPVRSNVKREYRQREVYALDILEVSGKDVLLRAEVESGTYIRKLVHDIGESLKVGAHMSELRRTKVANLTEKDNLVTLQDIEDATYYRTEEHNDKFLSYVLQNMEKAIDFMPKVWVSDFAVDSISHGSPLAVPGMVKINDFEKGEMIFLSTLKGELIALGRALESSQEAIKMHKGIIVKTDSVIMPIGTYPRYIKS
jgi:H/ACA ribonucleoprotein complex subunit 4